MYSIVYFETIITKRISIFSVNYLDINIDQFANEFENGERDFSHFVRNFLKQLSIVFKSFSSALYVLLLFVFNGFIWIKRFRIWNWYIVSAKQSKIDFNINEFNSGRSTSMNHLKLKIFDTWSREFGWRPKLQTS